MSKDTKIYVAFSSSGLFGSTQTYPLHHPDQEVLSNKQIMNELEKRVEGVDFVGKTEIEKPEYTLANVKGQKKSLDGILYFGSLPEELVDIDLPIIAVYPLWGQWQSPFNSYKGNRVLTACLPIIPDKDEDKFLARLESIVDKIELIKSVAKTKGLRILNVTDLPVLGAYEPTAYQIGEEGREEYERKYLENLAGLGMEIIVRPQEEMVARMKAVDEREATKVADKWIEGAEGIKGTNENEILKSAKLYLTMKEMMEEYRADAITTEGYGVFMGYKDGPIPSQGLPSSQFCTDGIVATSETLVDSLITQQLGLEMTGSTGFNGDYVIDENNNKVYIGHCECPFNPYGDERRVPYIVRNLPQWPKEEQEKGGAAVQVNLPTNELVTVAKIGVHDKKLSLFTGEAVDGEELFPGWYDILCRTKLAIDCNARRLLENVDWKTFGVHRVVFYGNHRQEFKDLATLLGYEVIEKDR